MDLRGFASLLPKIVEQKRKAREERMSLIQMAGGIALLLWGTYMVKTGMLRTFGVKLREFLAHRLQNRVAGGLAGMVLAALLQSATAGRLIIASLQSERLVTTPMAFSAILGADLGSAVMSRLLTLDLSFLSPLLIFGGTILFFRGRADTRTGQFGRIVIGFGFVMLALQQIVASTMPLRTSPELMVLFEHMTQMPAMAMLLGMVLGFACFSSLAAVIITLGLVSGGMIPVSTGLWMVLGAEVENTLLGVMASMMVSRKRCLGALANALWRMAMIGLAAAALVWVPEIPAFFAELEDSPIYFHVAFNACVCLLGLPAAGILGRCTERLMPGDDAFEEEEEDFTRTAGLFSKESLMGSAVSIQRAETEILRLVKAVYALWQTLGTMLGTNPPKGDIMMLLDQKAHLAVQCTTISRYLGLVMRGGLTQEEAWRWQYLKNLNASLGQQLEVVDQIVRLMDDKKCSRHRAFTSEGLVELEDLHGQVLASIGALGKLISSTDPVERQALGRTLQETRGHLIQLSYERTEHHMLRVSRGETGAVDTSALHLELQTLFIRFAGLVCTSVNIEAQA